MGSQERLAKKYPLGLPLGRSGNPVRDTRDVLRYIWTHPSNSGRRLRTIARALRYQMRARLFHKPTIEPIGERSRFIAYPETGLAGLVYANPFEWREIGLWRRTLKPGDLFIDIGANIGSYTLWAIELGATVIAIEPSPRSATMLRENLSLNGYTAEVIEAAIADFSGSARMTSDKGALNHLVLGDGADAGVTDRVEVRTLDEVLGDRVAAGVKVDVEGAEPLVVRGAIRAFTEHRIKLIQFEWNPYSKIRFGEERRETAAFLESLGYEFFRPGDHGGIIPLQTPGPAWDVFARPRG